MRPNDVLKWKEFITHSGRSVTEVSDAIASRGYLSGLFSAARENPNKMPQPSASLVMRLSKEISVPVGILMGEEPTMRVTHDPQYANALNQQSSRIMSDVMTMIYGLMAQRGVRPTVEEVIGWWRRTEGKMISDDKITDAFDLVNIPDTDAKTVTPYRVGATSLSSTAFGEPSTDRLRRLVESLDPASQEDLACSYRKASKSKEPIFSEPLSISLQNRLGDNLEVHYIRVQMNVSSPNNQKFVANYCFPV